MAQTKQSNSSFFSCCTGGDDQARKQAYVNLNEKKIQTIPVLNRTVVTDSYQRQNVLHAVPEVKDKKPTRPVSVPPRSSIVRTIVKPKIKFNYINAIADLGIQLGENKKFEKKHEVFVLQQPGCTKKPEIKPMIQPLQPPKSSNSLQMTSGKITVINKKHEIFIEQKPGCTKTAEIKPVLEVPQVSDCIKLTPEDIDRIDRK